MRLRHRAPCVGGARAIARAAILLRPLRRGGHRRSHRRGHAPICPGPSLRDLALSRQQAPLAHGLRRRPGFSVAADRARKSRGVDPVQRWNARVKCAGSEYPSARPTSPITASRSLSICWAAARRARWTTSEMVSPVARSRRCRVRTLVPSASATRSMLAARPAPASSVVMICWTRCPASRADESCADEGARSAVTDLSRCPPRVFPMRAVFGVIAVLPFRVLPRGAEGVRVAFRRRMARRGGPSARRYEVLAIRCHRRAGVLRHSSTGDSSTGSRGVHGGPFWSIAPLPTRCPDAPGRRRCAMPRRHAGQVLLPPRSLAAEGPRPSLAPTPARHWQLEGAAPERPSRLWRLTSFPPGRLTSMPPGGSAGVTS